MKCSKCGKEFGEGVNCQNCGVDRVTGLANYSNYGTSDYQGTNASYNESSYSPSPKTTVCYACSEIIPLGSTFCPVCGKKLLVTCPNCGFEYSSQFPVCSKCGTDREQYNKQLEAKRQKEIAEKQEKERKQRAWEQMQRQREQQIANENVGCLRNMISFAFLCGGISILLVILLVHTTSKKHSNEDVELNLIICAAIAIIVGLFIMKRKKG